MPEKPRDHYLKFQTDFMDKERERRERGYEKERERAQNPPTVIVGATGDFQSSGTVVVNQ